MTSPTPSPDYDEWILENVDNPFGTCREWSWAMAAFFPELRLAKGRYVQWDGRRFCHWWCVGPDGTIVDPTRAQFNPGDYIEITEEKDVPTGACMNCGEECFEGHQTCCDDCSDENADFYRARWAVVR